VAITTNQWLQNLEIALQDTLRRSDVPTLDIEWLLHRCRDTQTFSGEYHDSSLRQLMKEVAEFSDEFPGLLPAEILICPWPSASGCPPGESDR
jgi:hypothetical protein